MNSKEEIGYKSMEEIVSLITKYESERDKSDFSLRELLEVAEYYVMTEQYKRAEKVLTEVDGKNAEYDKSLCAVKQMILFKMQKYAELVSFFEQIGESDSVFNLVAQAGVLVKQNRIREALDLCEEAIIVESEPGGDVEAIMELILDVLPNNVSIILEIEKLVKKGLECNPKSIYLLRRYAMMKLISSQEETALFVYERLLEVDPTDHVAWANVADIRSGMWLRSTALDAVNRALKINRCEEYLILKARILASNERCSEAVKLLNKEFKMNSAPSDADLIAIEVYGYSLIKLAKIKDAAKWYGDLIAKVGSDDEMYLLMYLSYVVLLIELKQYEECRSFVKTLCKNFRDMKMWHIFEIELCILQKQYNEAITLCRMQSFPQYQGEDIIESLDNMDVRTEFMPSCESFDKVDGNLRAMAKAFEAIAHYYTGNLKLAKRTYVAAERIDKESAENVVMDFCGQDGEFFEQMGI